jgi:6-phosphogluconolactonase (cycloisomerase 2 family)
MSAARSRILAFASLAALVITLLGAAPSAAGDGAGNVYTLTNAASANAVLVFARAATGDLVPAGSFATGGRGTGTGLGSQGAVTLSRDGRWLIAVNAGSDEISVFRVSGHELTITDRIWSGGTRPISVTTSGGVAYVVNAGATPSIAGFTLSPDGMLTPIAGSTRALLGSGPAQIQFSRTGDVLVVSNKASSTLDTFVVSGGVASAATSHPSSGATPFGFDVGLRGQLFVSEAAGAPGGLSAASSYRLDAEGKLMTVTASASTTQRAACWLVVTENGRYAFTANAASDSISSFAIDQDGALTLVEATAAHDAAAHTTDLALSRDSAYLYALDGGTRSISAYRVAVDGSLTRVGSTSVPATAVGLAAR